ncbi:hypothetical protein [Streptomyces sp. NPDC055243]|uniref:hypothetical protein n=1 Tax=Streptomyces sp. NPDC055243 TaxID=3365720 RepID=UPI0037CFE279
MPESPSADALLDGTGRAIARGVGWRGGAVWRGSGVAGPTGSPRDGDRSPIGPGDLHV